MESIDTLRFHAMWSQICAVHVADPEVGSHPFSRVTGVFGGDDGLKPYLSRSTDDIGTIYAPDGLRTCSILQEWALFCEEVVEGAAEYCECDENELTLGDVIVSKIDERGAWKGRRRADEGELSFEDTIALEDAAKRGAHALRKAGYFGPFNVDAFRYRKPEGGNAFHPACEINARYTMAWALGMGRRRPDREFIVASCR